MIPIDLMTAGTVLVALVIVAGAALRMWQGWLEFKTRQLELHRVPMLEIEGGAREGAARIELADLKERIRKLEAIANGVDL